MDEKNVHLDTLQDIRQMMERSSRFISLSGLSGIGAGICALGGAYATYRFVAEETAAGWDYRELAFQTDTDVQHKLLQIGALTFIAALTISFVFTYIRSVKTETPIWSQTTRRLLWNTMIPLLVGGIACIRFIQLGFAGLVAPCCLLFYGLALINGSKYTLTEIRWLGYSQLILGVINLWFIGYGLLFWAIGFGLLHIFYGAIMWWKYEKK